MKKKSLLFASCLLGVFAFSSCEKKNLYDESKQPEEELQLKDLDIPADFQWKLTQLAEGTTSANTPVMVSFFLDETCSEAKKIANIPVYTEAISLPFSLPSYATTLYAQYESETGTKTQEVPIKADGSYSLRIDDAKVATRAITRGNDIEDDITKVEGVVYHPSTGWGTIMFEDQFPILGDYDFNDFVINYKVQFQEVKGDKKDKYTAQYIQIGLRLKAVGGIFPYSPYLRLKEIDSDEVESIEIYESHNITPDPIGDVTLIKNKHVVIDCSPLINNLQKPAGSRYFNTETDALAATEDLPEIHFLIELKKAKDIKDILEDDEFDLYLKRDNGTEIHMNGIEPVSYKYPFDNKDLYPVYESDGDEEDDNYYFSKERLIWGLRVPDNIAHAIEGANFLEAYKGFAKWAQSGGKNDHNWYNQGNVNKGLLIYN